MLDSCSMVACLNHGNFSNGRCNSSSPRSSQSPCTDTLVTSGAEVAVPGILDLLNVRFDDGLRFAELTDRKTSGRGNGDLWHEPEFCLTVRVRDVHVDSS